MAELAVFEFAVAVAGVCVAYPVYIVVSIVYMWVWNVSLVRTYPLGMGLRSMLLCVG